MGFEGMKLFFYGRYKTSNKDTKQIAFDANQKNIVFWLTFLYPFWLISLGIRILTKKGYQDYCFFWLTSLPHKLLNQNTFYLVYVKRLCISERRTGLTV